MVANIIQSDHDITGGSTSTATLASAITSGSLLIFMSVHRNGSVAPDPGETGSGTYIELNHIDHELPSGDPRYSWDLSYMIAGASEDTSVTGGQSGSLIEIDLDGQEWDWANREVVTGIADSSGGNPSSVTTSATSSLASATYLILAFGSVKTNANSDTADAFSGISGITDITGATATGYKCANGFGVHTATLSGTQTLTMTPDSTDDQTLFVGLVIVPSAAATTELQATRWFDDDGSESAATALAAQNVAITGRASETNTRLRVQIQTTGDVASGDFTLQYRKVGDTPWNDIE